MTASKHPLPPAATVSVPKRWLIALAVLFIVPWVIAAAIYVRADRVEASAAPEGAPEASMGMPAADVSRLMGSARPDTATNGLTLFPDAALVRGLSRDVRLRLYTQLAKSRLNRAQAEAYRFLGTAPGDWFTGSPVSAATRAIVEPLIYRDGPFLHFADLESVRSEITDETEWRLLRKALMRSSTLLVRLAVEVPAEVNALSQYWGAHGRRLDIRPLLESVAGAAPDRSIDVIHLLPALARNHLYRYPKLTAADLDKPLLANCLWSALNFFDL